MRQTAASLRDHEDLLMLTALTGTSPPRQPPTPMAQDTVPVFGAAPGNTAQTFRVLGAGDRTREDFVSAGAGSGGELEPRTTFLRPTGAAGTAMQPKKATAAPPQPLGTPTKRSIGYNSLGLFRNRSPRSAAAAASPTTASPKEKSSFPAQYQQSSSPKSGGKFPFTKDHGQETLPRHSRDDEDHGNGLEEEEEDLRKFESVKEIADDIDIVETLADGLRKLSEPRPPKQPEPEQSPPPKKPLRKDLAHVWDGRGDHFGREGTPSACEGCATELPLMGDTLSDSNRTSVPPRLISSAVHDRVMVVVPPEVCV